MLAGEGLISVTKGYEGRRPRTWVEITRAGDAALAAQMAAMKELVARFESRSRQEAPRRGTWTTATRAAGPRVRTV